VPPPMKPKNEDSPHYRGCVIKCQKAKKLATKPWVEAQVTMPDKTIICVQAKQTKPELMKAARDKIDVVLAGGWLWKRWVTGQMERDYEEIPATAPQ